MNRPQYSPILVTLSALGLAATALSGCVTEKFSAQVHDSPFMAGVRDRTAVEDWSEVRPEKRVQAHEARFDHFVLFDTGKAGLNDSERSRLEAFLRRIEVQGSDQVFVVNVPTGDRAAARLAQRRQATVLAYLELSHLRAHVLPQPLAGDLPPAGSVALTVQRFVVSVPKCPDWSGWPGNNFNNQAHRNLGCATAGNLGVMVNDPRDLARIRDMGPYDGNHAVLGIQRYRSDKIRPLDPEDVGQLEAQQKVGQSGEAKE
ncbi:MAG: hypothetical protein H6907_07730 [Hyphomicrobiales bacterium]|nr:hypothetical protein [Hyphomicrobiales bacterium]MCP5371608.1 hypothetical protein [Hyphomicrobiales bacterium]